MKKKLIHLTQLLNCQEHHDVWIRLRLAPVVHETLEILEKHVLVFVQKPLDGISAMDGEGESESNQSNCP